MLQFMDDDDYVENDVKEMWSRMLKPGDRYFNEIMKNMMLFSSSKYIRGMPLMICREESWDL